VVLQVKLNHEMSASNMTPFERAKGKKKKKAIPFRPYFASEDSTCSLVKPDVGDTWKCARTSSTEYENAFSILFAEALELISRSSPLLSLR
jgi:hypothetical protein